MVQVNYPISNDFKHYYPDEVVLPIMINQLLLKLFIDWLSTRRKKSLPKRKVGNVVYLAKIKGLTTKEAEKDLTFT